MSFFDDVDETGVVENHIQEVLKLEDESAQKILRRYRHVRNEIRQRLDGARQDSYTAQKLRGTLAQVQGAIDAMNGSLEQGMGDAAGDMALMGVEHLLEEIRRFSEKFEGAVVPINLRAQKVALDTKNFLLAQYESSIQAYGAGLIQQLTANITQSMIMQNNAQQMVDRMSMSERVGRFFDGEEWKLHRIVRTELHNVYGLGKINGMRSTREDAIPDLMKALMHPMDSRTGKDSQWVAKNLGPIGVDEFFSYRWGGKTRTFLAPPDRPNDRAILVPYREAWGYNQGTAFIPVNSRLPRARK